MLETLAFDRVRMQKIDFDDWSKPAPQTAIGLLIKRNEYYLINKKIQAAISRYFYLVSLKISLKVWITFNNK